MAWAKTPESWAWRGHSSDGRQQAASAAAKARSGKCLERLSIYRVREPEGGGQTAARITDLNSRQS